ncbi:unknown [Firmicutes bacterium CAG:449]|nr:unknown [Firmicutes bacterium CAG:449]
MVFSFSIKSQIALALFFPVAINTIFLACIMVSNPEVIAFVGTSSREEKNLELSFIVEFFNSTICVFSLNMVPGSLNAICPLLPIPNI